MRLMLNNIDKNEIKEYENLVNENFLIENNLHSKKFNRNKIVKVAKVLMKNGSSKDVYHNIRTTKYIPGTKEFERTSEYLDIYKQKVDLMLTV